MLLSRKSQAAYKHIFEYIKNNVVDFNPNSITTDYETALRNAIKIVYPQAKFVGCWFHFIQAVQRNSKSIPNFIRHIRRNEKSFRLYKKFLLLPLLKETDLLVGWKILQNEALLLNESTNIFEKFIKYFERQWILKVKMKKYLILYS